MLGEVFSMWDKGHRYFFSFLPSIQFGRDSEKVHELVENERRLDGLAWVSPLCFARLTHEPAAESRLGRC